MIERLLELVEQSQRQSRNITITVEYHKTLDWCVEVGFYREGSYHSLFRLQHPDLNRVAAEAYVALTEWMSETFGGY